MKKKRINCVLLMISVFFLLVGFIYPILTFLSAFIAILVAFLEMWESSKLEKKINEYDEALQTRYDENNNITSITIDCGTY